MDNLTFWLIRDDIDKLANDYKEACQSPRVDFVAAKKTYFEKRQEVLKVCDHIHPSGLPAWLRYDLTHKCCTICDLKVDDKIVSYGIKISNLKTGTFGIGPRLMSSFDAEALSIWLSDTLNKDFKVETIEYE